MFAKKENILDREPYVTFLKKFNKLDSLSNANINMRISSNFRKEAEECNQAFSLDYLYAKSFELDFQFVTFFDEEYLHNQRFCIFHTISYKFEDEEYQNMMMDTIGDFQKRNGYLYISSLVQECEINASVNNQNVVTISFRVFYDDQKCAKEICLELISQDIALFARSF